MAKNKQGVNWYYWVGIFMLAGYTVTMINPVEPHDGFSLGVWSVWGIVGLLLFLKGTKIQKKRKEEYEQERKGIIDKKCPSCGYFFETRNKKQTKCDDCKKKKHGKNKNQ